MSYAPQAFKLTYPSVYWELNLVYVMAGYYLSRAESWLAGSCVCYHVVGALFNQYEGWPSSLQVMGANMFLRDPGCPECPMS